VRRGLTAPAAISTVGEEYERNGSGVWSSSVGTVANGDTVRVRHTSAATYSTAVSTTLTIGGVSDAFTSTTLNAPSVTLTEAPGSGASFKQWGGACSGTTTTCMVTMTANQTVTATFSQVFTDAMLTAGSTLIKAVHFSELRSAINTLRVVNSLAAFAWTDPTLTAGSTPAKKVHLDELRTALNAAYQAAGLPPPGPTPTPPSSRGRR